MNSFERVHSRLSGKPVDRPPNFDIFMTLAAHASGEKLHSYYNDYRVLCQANFFILEKYKLDLVQAISDPYREAADLGVQIEFPEDDLPVRRSILLEETHSLPSLNSVQPWQGRRMADRLEAVRLMREQVGAETWVMGWVEGALALAAVLRGFSTLSMDLIDRPEWVADLLEFCVQIEVDFVRAQIDAGAHIIGLGDAVASQISPRMYRHFALPYEKRIFQAVHQMHALARLHICGNTTRILPDMLESGADIIDIDYMVNMKAASEVFANQASVCGNIDPVSVFLKGTPEMVRQQTIHCMEDGGPRSFSAAGCEIPDHTPEENIMAQVLTLQDFH
jgi:MtaA/CmuA family methyltransferase